MIFNIWITVRVTTGLKIASFFLQAFARTDTRLRIHTHTHTQARVRKLTHIHRHSPPLSLILFATITPLICFSFHQHSTFLFANIRLPTKPTNSHLRLAKPHLIWSKHSSQFWQFALLIFYFFLFLQTTTRSHRSAD